jgi:hypothetical protein
MTEELSKQLSDLKIQVLTLTQPKLSVPFGEYEIVVVQDIKTHSYHLWTRTDKIDEYALYHNMKLCFTVHTPHNVDQITSFLKRYTRMYQDDVLHCDDVNELKDVIYAAIISLSHFVYYGV